MSSIRQVAGGDKAACDCTCSGGGVTICGCPDVPTTLYYTDSVLGSCTLTYTGSILTGWTGSLPTTSIGGTLFGCGTCAPAGTTVSVQFYELSGSCRYLLRFNHTNSFPFCPAATGLSQAYGTSPLSIACSPFVGTSTIDLSIQTCATKQLYGAASGTVTITLTE